MRVVSCLVGDHNLYLVGLAALVCVLGSIITFRLFSRTAGRTGVQVKGWIFLTSVAAGSAAWCTHFIAMLAYRVEAPVEYEPLLTMLSLIVAILGSGLGFSIAAANGTRTASFAVGGAFVGLALSAMHYIGMAAYHVSGIVAWDRGYVFASVVAAAALGAVAMAQMAGTADREDGRIAAAWRAAVSFVLATVSLHFIGMAAVEVTPQFASDTSENVKAAETIAVAVAGVGLLIIGTGVASYLIDEQAAQETIERLQRLAMCDTLTELPNRAHFNEVFALELERARLASTRLAAIVIDLNNFKVINDQRGHKAGDQALKIIAQRLAGELRHGEFIARVGGDEFTAIKRYDDLLEVDEFIARILQSLNEPVVVDDFIAVTGGSIGVALFPDHGLDSTQLLTKADLAMYRAKSDVSRDVCFYDKDMDEAARERTRLTSDLRHALSNNEFELHYQVQHDIHSERITGYEALIRWRHPERGMISPADFIPLAEETGLIEDIGEWVLRTACREAASWTEPHRIAVNLSGVQLKRGDLGDVIQKVLVETGLEPGRLEIEITETAIIEDKEQALKILRQVRDIGAGIAIDDFGVGYSSLETLRTFPFDKIKLDRSFTSSLEGDPQAIAIVRAVLALGESLKIRVLAEGVETQTQLSILRFEGCNEAQGFLLGRPGPKVRAGVAAVARGRDCVDGHQQTLVA